MRAILVAIGSHGDVHPYIGLGLALRDRGHDVTVLANGHFESLARRAGLGFHPIGTDDDFRRSIADKDLWHPRRALRKVMQFTSHTVMPTYEYIRDHYVPGQTFVAASSLGLGARLAEDKLGVPTATVHLAPSIFRSAVDPMYVPGIGWLRRMPPGFVNWFWETLEKYMVDPVVAPWLNEMRKGLDLPPVRSVIWTWMNSPRLTIGMFPDWFAPPAPDWPKQVRLTHFPLYDERHLPDHQAPPTAMPRPFTAGQSAAVPGAAPARAVPHPTAPPTRLPDDLEQFLASGPAPVAFTPGSAMVHGDRFFRTAVDACGRADLRALLLTRHPDQVPPNLPATIKHVPFAPFSQLLPRCAAIVHHGGIGTLSQGLAAGVPHLVMPMAHDQPDNARRVERLGVGAAVYPRAFKPKRVAATLRHLTTDPAVAAACRATAKRFHNADGIGQTCDLLESLATAPAAAPAAA